MQGLQNSLFLKMKTWSSKLSWIKLTGETFKEIRSMIFFKRKFLNLLKTKMDYHPWQKAFNNFVRLQSGSLDPINFRCLTPNLIVQNNLTPITNDSTSLTPKTDAFQNANADANL